MSINLEARCIWRRADVAVNQSDEKNFVRFPKRLQKWQIVEALIDPNANVDPKFTTTNIETKAGLAMTGFVEKEDDDTLTLKIAGGIVQAYKKADLRKRENLKQSSMPEGLGNTMSAGEFIDLVQFLSERKYGRGAARDRATEPGHRR